MNTRTNLPRMLGSWRASVFELLIAALVAGPVLAHHSFSMFDFKRPTTISGTVTEFQWTNPHVYIELDVPEAGNAKHYSVQSTSPSIMLKLGWKFKDLKLGDKVTLLIFPLRDGSPGGALFSATLADGRVLKTGFPDSTLTDGKYE